MGWTSMKGLDEGSALSMALAEYESHSRLDWHYREANDEDRQGELYLLLENRAGRTLIGITLISNEGGDWGWKHMDESMMPFYFKCPLDFLDRADEPVNESAAKWRQGVVEYHKENGNG